jgi:hypothetical protein
MTGIVDNSHVRIPGRAAKFPQGVPHFVGADIQPSVDDVEFSFSEHCGNRVRVVCRITQGADVLVGRIADYQRHPLFGKCGLAEQPARP